MGQADVGNESEVLRVMYKEIIKWYLQSESKGHKEEKVTLFISTDTK